MSIIFDQYEERLERLKRHRNTIQNFNRAAELFSEYLDNQHIDPARVEPHQIEEYLAGLDYATSTKKNHLIQLGAAYRYAVRRGMVSRDPTVDVQLPREPDEEPRVIPNEALREMKAKLFTDREWLIWHLLTYTGMRRHEILGLRWDDIKFDGKPTITVVGKGGKLRHIPIHPALGEVLRERQPKEGHYVIPGRSRTDRPTQMATHTFWHVVHCITGGKYTAHDFRRTVSSSLYANGVDGDTIDKIMGWSPRVVRTRYYQAIASDVLQRAILKLYRDDPI